MGHRATYERPFPGGKGPGVGQPSPPLRRGDGTYSLPCSLLRGRVRVGATSDDYSVLSSSRISSKESGVISSTVAIRSTLACTISRAFRTVSSSGAS